MKLFWILVCIVAIIVLIFIIKHYKTPRIDTLNAISGGLGGGKTSSCICRVVSLLRSIYFLFRNKKVKNDYIVLSNFPIGKIEKKTGKHYLRIWFKKIYCYDINVDVLLLKEKLPQDEVIIVWDEFSNIATQFDFNNPLLKNNMTEFFRYFRHYTHGLGYFFAIDQCSADMFLQIRRRIAYCYNMVSCRKLPLIPIITFEYRKILISDEVSNMVDIEKGTDESDLRKFIFFVNPFKYYDSYAYSDRYNSVTKKLDLISIVGMKKYKLDKLPYSNILYYETLINDDINEEQYIEINKKKKK